MVVEFDWSKLEIQGIALARVRGPAVTFGSINDDLEQNGQVTTRAFVGPIQGAMPRRKSRRRSSVGLR